MAEGIAIELLAKVLDHVIALGLAVHEDVQPQRLLLAHAAGNFDLHGRLIRRGIQTPGLEFAAGAADVGGLRKRADGGGGEWRQLEQCRLFGTALGIRALALAQTFVDLGECGLHGGTIHT